MAQLQGNGTGRSADTKHREGGKNIMAEQKDRYEDIINLPHHVSEEHPQMPMAERAAQFSPFAALTGFGNVIRETERQTDQMMELSENEKEELDYKLEMLCNLPGEKPYVSITYFVPDGRKQGGAYRILRGKLKKTDPLKREIVMEDGNRIQMDFILELNIDSVIE